MDYGFEDKISNVFVAGVRLLRLLKLKSVIRAVKTRSSLDLTRDLHNEAVHRVREFSSAEIMGEDWAEKGGITAIEMCTACKKVMGNILELTEDEMHCCLKGFEPKQGDDDDVLTVARSEPFGNRTINSRKKDAHPVSKNSVWSAILGQNDGGFAWKPVICFHCGDLYMAGDHFKCTRPNWREYYRSTLVFPICYIDQSDTKHKTISGFLAFDSLQKKAFGNLPNIFDYRDRDIVNYVNRLKKYSQFHLGALLADMMSIFLKPLYQKE